LNASRADLAPSRADEERSGRAGESNVRAVCGHGDSSAVISHFDVGGARNTRPLIDLTQVQDR